MRAAPMFGLPGEDKPRELGTERVQETSPDMKAACKCVRSGGD